MKPVAWIKIRELSYMKAVAEHGKDDWQTNLGLKPEPDDEGLYTETQVQRMIELLKRCVEAIGLVLATLNLDDVYPAQRELLREALRAAKQSQDTTCPDCERLEASDPAAAGSSQTPARPGSFSSRCISAGAAGC